MDVSEGVINHLRHVHQAKDTYCSLNTSNLRSIHLCWTRSRHPLALRRKHGDLGSMVSICHVVYIYFERARRLKSTQLARLVNCMHFMSCQYTSILFQIFSLFYLSFRQSARQDEELYRMNHRLTLLLVVETSSTCTYYPQNYKATMAMEPDISGSRRAQTFSSNCPDSCKPRRPSPWTDFLVEQIGAVNCH